MPIRKHHTVITEDIERALHLKGPLARLVCRILKVEPLIELNNRYGNLPQDQFMQHALEELGIAYEVDPASLANIPATGGFITVSNHPTGMAEGVILKAVLGRVRPDFKTLSTTMLNLFPGLDASSIPVNNLAAKPGAQNLGSIRSALAHLAAGGALGLFPAGEVSSWQPRHKKTALGKRVVEDRPWEESITKLIRHAHVPVIPIYFEGKNTRRFHILGQIHPRLRTATLVPEFVRQRGHTFRMVIGEPIPPEKLDGFDIPALGRWLRSRTYALEALTLPPPASEFRYTADGQAILPKCIELGRFFIDKEYQREELPPKLIFASLRCAAARFPDARYFLGIVSIPNSIPLFYKSLMAHFLQKTALLEGAPLAVPHTPFSPDFLRVDPDQLLGNLYGDPAGADQLDALLDALSGGRYRMPAPVREAFSLGARLICFNVNNDCLDGLFLLRSQDLPEELRQTIQDKVISTV